MGSGQCGSRPVYCTAETHFFTINDSFITAEKILKEEKTREENTIFNHHYTCSIRSLLNIFGL